MIEVDGYKYHKKYNKQKERDILKNNILSKYNIPLIRLTTNGSREKDIIINKLNNIFEHNYCLSDLTTFYFTQICLII